MAGNSRQDMENIIEVKNLKKTYLSRGHKTEALKGISFEVKRGEIFGILGVNGAGKSTTLSILMDLLTPTSGTIEFFGKDFRSNTEEVKSRTWFPAPASIRTWKGIETIQTITLTRMALCCRRSARSALPQPPAPVAFSAMWVGTR